jgi:hypothetical protein
LLFESSSDYIIDYQFIIWRGLGILTQPNQPSGPMFTPSAKGFLGLLATLLGSLGLWPRLWTHSSLWGSWLLVQSLLPIMLAVIYLRACRDKNHSNKVSFDIKFSLTLKQVIQQLAQVSIYIGLSIHWPQMREQLPLTLAQVIFAYQLDIFWVWLRRSPQYRLSLSPTPIILSINLFIWFKDSVFYWQWLLVVFAIFSRSLFTYKEAKQNGLLAENEKEIKLTRNIFNPSALAISVAGILLILTRSTHLTWGESLAIQHGAGDYAYWTIFAAGFLAQFFVPIVWVTVAGTLSYLFLDGIYYQLFTSYQFIDTAIPPAVFLGLNLLITDPRTIPKKRLGQIFYGIAYACLSFACFSLLKTMVEPANGSTPAFNPSFLDKALAIPLLNLTVPLINRLSSSQSPLSHRGTHQAILAVSWLLLFILYVHPQLKLHPGKKLIFWTETCRDHIEQSSLKAQPSKACQVRDHLLAIQCETGDLKLCHNLALSPWTKPKSAQHLLKNTCQKGLSLSCVVLGEQYYDQALQMRSQNLSPQQVFPLVNKAQELWTPICGLKEKATTNLNQPTLAPSDAKEAQQSLSQACFHLANLLATPWARPPQMTEAWLHLERACQYGLPQACEARRQSQ